MTKQQEKMAVLALDFIAQNNNAVSKNDLLKDMRLKNGDDNLTRANRSIVYDKLTQELALVRLTGQSLISLTENGEVAQRMGFPKYMKRLHGQECLEVKIKRLDFWIKLIDLLDKSKILIIVVLVLLYIFMSLCVAFFYRLSPTLSGTILLILGVALGAILTHILSMRQRKRQQ